MLEYNQSEIKLFKKLDSPKKIQDFLAFKIRHNPARDGVECRSPREVLKIGKAHCMEGALLAAAILEFHGQKPLLMDLRSTADDLDHVVALFRQFECWGAISKTNHVVLRYREPIYKTVRELALSYFHEYFLDSGKKTLREYSVPVDLKYLDKCPPLCTSRLTPVQGKLTPPVTPRLSLGVTLSEAEWVKGGETAVIPPPFLPAEALAKEGGGRLGGGENWRITEKDLVELPEYLDKTKHYKILNNRQIKNLRKADDIEIKAGKLTEWIVKS